jgi:AraC family transcriptional regulator, regulatory protein of adaptative response / DNA-3-methyladenine glycosylase II
LATVPIAELVSLAGSASGSDSREQRSIGHYQYVGSFNAVVTTGIYCLPSCGGRPNRNNVQTFELAAAAEAAGFRACLRCRPYRTHPSLSYQAAPELVCNAVRLIIDGALDDSTESDLGASLGVSGRHLRRLCVEHLGVTPDQLARSTRVHFARMLLDSTDLSFAEVTFAAGFGSIRQFNRACQEIFRATPGELRARRRAGDRLIADGGIVLRMSFEPPFDWEAMLDLMRARAIRGVEQVSADSYRRTVMIEGDPGILEVSPGERNYLLVRAHLPHWKGLIHIVQRARRLFNLDADAVAASRRLGADPLIGPLAWSRPGIRPPGTWEPFEAAVEAIIGEYASQGETNMLMQHIAEHYGAPIPGVRALGLTRTFPSPRELASADLRCFGLSTGGAAAIRDLSEAAASRLANPITGTRHGILQDIAHLGPGVVQSVRLRLGERDAFPSASPEILRALSQATGHRITSEQAESVADTWRPWRAHAATYLWLSDIVRPREPTSSAR